MNDFFISRGFFPIISSVFNDVEKVVYDSFKSAKTSYPMNIIDLGEEGFKIEIALAGFSKEDISVDINENVLNINVSVPERLKQVSDEFYIRRGISHREMNQSFQIGEKIDISGVSVCFVDGLLTVNLPLKKVIETNNRKIDII